MRLESRVRSYAEGKTVFLWLLCSQANFSALIQFCCFAIGCDLPRESVQYGFVPA